MSDSTVIDQFVGNYESDGVITNVDPKKRIYYPVKGVKLNVKKQLVDGVEGKAYAKITILPGEEFEGKMKLEQAVFRVLDDDLIADTIEIQPGLLLQERLTMQKNSNGKKEMKHTLRFSDGSLGTWICKT
jgi:hypothetical protein